MRVVVRLPVAEEVEAAVVTHPSAVLDNLPREAVDVEERIHVVAFRADVVGLRQPGMPDLILRPQRPVLAVLDLHIRIVEHLAGWDAHQPILGVQALYLQTRYGREIVRRTARCAQPVGGRAGRSAQQRTGGVGDQRQVVPIARIQLVFWPVVEHSPAASHRHFSLLCRVPGKPQPRRDVIVSRVPELWHVVHLHIGNPLLPRGAALKHSIVQPVEPFRRTREDLPANTQVQRGIRP